MIENNENMKEAIILAGGLGTRLQSVVNDRPKCMALVAGEPFLKYILDYLYTYKIDHIILSLGYKYELILDWIKDQDYPFKISYVIEQEPLGTGGAIQLATSKLETNSCFVLNGDTFFDVDLENMMQFHLSKSADITLALKPMTDFDRYGCVRIDNNDIISEFLEKKYNKEGLINGGIYLLNTSILKNKPYPDQFSFEKGILENNDNNLKKIGFKSDTYFIDIGIPSDYKKANSDFLMKNKTTK